MTTIAIFVGAFLGSYVGSRWTRDDTLVLLELPSYLWWRLRRMPDEDTAR